jgi:hypothetical protein
MSSLPPTSLTTSSSSSKSEGYGSISRDDSDEFDEAAALMAPTVTTVADEFGVAKGGVCRNCNPWARRLILGALLGVLVVMIVGGTIFPTTHSNPNHHKTGIRVNHHDYSEASSSSSSFDAKPSFQISPIDDMGMLSVKRNDDALPSSVWGNHLHQKGHPLPTNSWYLVRFDSIPFVSIPFVSIRFHLSCFIIFVLFNPFGNFFSHEFLCSLSMHSY